MEALSINLSGTYSRWTPHFPQNCPMLIAGFFANRVSVMNDQNWEIMFQSNIRSLIKDPALAFLFWQIANSVANILHLYPNIMRLRIYAIANHRGLSRMEYKPLQEWSATLRRGN